MRGFHITCYECNKLYPEVGEYPSKYGVNPEDYCLIPRQKGGHKWLSIAGGYTINPDGTLTIESQEQAPNYPRTYGELIAILNSWLDQGYNVLWEGTIRDWLTITENALTTFMRRLNADLHDEIIWVSLNEVNGSWNAGFYGFSSFPPPQNEVDLLNANMQMARRIRDDYGLGKIKLAFAPSHDADPNWQFPIDWLKLGLDAGDYYSMSSYWSWGAAPYNWISDADTFVNYLIYGSRAKDPPYGGSFGGYMGGYDTKPWLLNEFGHKEWTDVNPAEWIERILLNFKQKAPFLNLVVFWGPMDYNTLAQLAPMYETTPTPPSLPPIMYFMPILVGGMLI